MSILIQCIWTACSHSLSNENAIYSAGDIEVYPDSIIISGHEYTATSRAEISGSWTAPISDSTGISTLSTSSRMADALYAKSMYRYNDELLTTLDIYLSAAILTPDRAMQMLRNYVSDGVINHPGYPVNASYEAWAAAAWQVYCTTGSIQWLKEAYKVITATYTRESNVLRTQHGLIHGTPSHLQTPRGFLPTWMLPVDEYQTIALGTNIWHYATLNTAALMARELNLKAEYEWARKASEVRNAINDIYWVPAVSYYGQYLYGDLYPILSTSSDNFANPLAVILGIPTPEMSERIMSARPHLPEGVPMVTPTPAGMKPTITPSVQTLQGIAASLTGNENALLTAIAATWRLSLGDNCTTQWPGLLLRGILGISVTPAGMTFSPTIPQRLTSTLSLTGLRYRDAILDINIYGTGNKIASFAIDSIPHDTHLIDASLSGKHRIDITLTGNRLNDSDNAISTKHTDTYPNLAPPTPRIYWADSRNAKILDYNQHTGYDVYLNGILSETLSSATYTITDTATTIVDIVPVLYGMSGYSPRSHIFAPDNARIHIPATAITPRRPPIHLIRDRSTASHYIELAARHNTRLTFYAQAQSAGEYFIRIIYSNGTSDTALRSLEVNDSYAGTLVCPSVSYGNWIVTGPSSTLRVQLNEGINKLSLTYINSTILLHDIYLLRK